MSNIDRRQSIISKIVSRCTVVDTGFVLNGKMSPCYLWTGPHSDVGRLIICAETGYVVRRII